MDQDQRSDKVTANEDERNVDEHEDVVPDGASKETIEDNDNAHSSDKVDNAKENQHGYNLRSTSKNTKDTEFNKRICLFTTISNKNKHPTSKIKVQHTDTIDEKEIRENTIGFNFTQMHATKGIKLLGQQALDAMETEYRQLERLDVFEPEHAHKLPTTEKKAALRAIDLIKIKRSGKIKGRTVADGSTQRAYISKEDSTSPAAHPDSLIATLVVDAMEDREVATADIAGAYLKAYMPDTVFLRVTGPAVDALMRINPTKYKEYITFEKGKKVLYLRLVKAMYGTLKASTLR